jgi:hypothetical protein
VSAASSDHEVVFQVADTGCGIAPMDLPESLTDLASHQSWVSRCRARAPNHQGHRRNSRGSNLWVESSEGGGHSLVHDSDSRPEASALRSLERIDGTK